MREREESLLGRSGYYRAIQLIQKVINLLSINNSTAILTSKFEI